VTGPAPPASGRAAPHINVHADTQTAGFVAVTSALIIDPPFVPAPQPPLQPAPFHQPDMLQKASRANSKSRVSWILAVFDSSTVN
jgi:hypothetical protein